jgi:hypothetical protein
MGLQRARRRRAVKRALGIRKLEKQKPPPARRGGRYKTKSKSKGKNADETLALRKSPEILAAFRLARHLLRAAW